MLQTLGIDAKTHIEYFLEMRTNILYRQMPRTTQLEPIGKIVVADSYVELHIRSPYTIPEDIERKVVSMVNNWIKNAAKREEVDKLARSLSYDLRMQDWAARNFNPSDGTKGE